MILFIVQIEEKTLTALLVLSILLGIAVLISIGMIIGYKREIHNKEFTLKLLDKLINSEFDNDNNFKNELVKSFYNKRE